MKTIFFLLFFLLEKLFTIFMGVHQTKKKSVFDSLHTELCFFAFFDISSLIENRMVM